MIRSSWPLRGAGSADHTSQGCGASLSQDGIATHLSPVYRPHHRDHRCSVCLGLHCPPVPRKRYRQVQYQLPILRQQVNNTGKRFHQLHAEDRWELGTIDPPRRGSYKGHGHGGAAGRALGRGVVGWPYKRARMWGVRSWFAQIGGAWSVDAWSAPVSTRQHNGVYGAAAPHACGAVLQSPSTRADLRMGAPAWSPPPRGVVPPW